MAEVFIFTLSDNLSIYIEISFEGVWLEWIKVGMDEIINNLDRIF